MHKKWNQQRGGFDNGPPGRGSRGRPNNRGRGRGHGRGGPPAHDSTPFVSTYQQLFESDVSTTVEVFDYNNMPSLDGLNGQKPNFRGRGSGRGRATRATHRGGPPLPVNSHSHPVFVPKATNGNYNMPTGRGRGALPLYDVDYLDPYAHSNHTPSPKKIKGGGLGFGNSPGPNSKPPGNGRGRWDPATRPYLIPIKFVHAKERLFEADPDELLQAHELQPHPSDDLDPQVEILEDVISHIEQPPKRVSPSSEDEAMAEETIIEMAVRSEMGVTNRNEAANEVENYIEEVLANGLHAAAVNQAAVVPVLRPETELFYLHSVPQVLPEASPGILFDRATELAIGQSHAENQEDDEIILYPSNTRSHSAPSPPSVVPLVVIHEETVCVMKVPTPPNDTPTNIPTSFSIGNSSTRSTFVPMRMRKEAKRTRCIERNKQKAKESKFFDYEEMVITGDAEEFIHGSPRVGDSDLEWGSDGPPQAVKDGVLVEKAGTSESEDGGMDVDDGLDEAALARFAMSVTNPQHLGFHDLEGEEESDGENSEVVGSGVSEGNLSGSGDSDGWTDEDEDEDEDEDDQTPDMQWQSRLVKMREKVNRAQRRTAADRDEVYLAYLEELLDDNTDILEGRDRKEKKALFRAIQNDDIDDLPRSGRYRKMKGVPVDLQDQWERDRLKKAERRRIREEQRKQGLLTKKTKKKDKENGQSLDLESVEAIMRDLVYDRSRTSVALPPLPKEIREQVHRMAIAFGLKSKSEGSKNKARKVMIISRFGKTGPRIDEFKVSKILRRPRPGGGGRGGHSRVAEGEVIGHKAAKISEDNIGYRLLAQMGWSEGKKIGLEGRGIDAPITAVMKKTKLGLGATR